MAVSHIVVVGASAGGVEALLTLARELKPDLPAAICVTLHQPRHSPSVLPRLMSRAGSLTVVHAEHGMELRRGHVYLAPPDRHLLVDRGHLRLDHGPLENGHRPAIDPLFRSAAAAFGAEVTAVVLSGSLDDGSAGATAVRRAGGRVVVQDPAEALYEEMPRNAMRAVGSPDAIVTIRELVWLLDGLRDRDRDRDRDREHRATDGPSGSSWRRDPADPDGSAMRPPDHDRKVYEQSLSCPSCGGSLHQERQEVGEGFHDHRWRCRVGHGWSLDSLFAEQGASSEAGLWAAVRVLEERAALCRQLRDRASTRGQNRAVGSFEAQALAAERHARSIRASIEELVPLLGPPDHDADQSSSG